MKFQQAAKSVYVRALVTDNKDPDKLARVKVIYPHFSGDAAQLPSEWARVCQPYASKGNGVWFLPEVGDEVLVVFQGENLEHPIVLGTFYSSKNSPPKSGRSGDLNDDGKNNLKFLKSKAGNLLVFDDSPGKEGVALKDSEGAQLKFEKGKIALGNKSAELFDLLDQLLDCLNQNASQFVSTAVGPGTLNPTILQKITETKEKIGQMKGKLD